MGVFSPKLELLWWLRVLILGMAGGLLVLLMVAAAGCDDAAPKTTAEPVTNPTSAPRNTQTPTDSPTRTDTSVPTTEPRAKSQEPPPRRKLPRLFRSCRMNCAPRGSALCHRPRIGS